MRLKNVSHQPIRLPSGTAFVLTGDVPSDKSLAGSLAVVTGASSGIGLSLAWLCADRGCDLVVAADMPEIDDVAGQLRERGVSVDSIQADLATRGGVDQLLDRIEGRHVDLLLANAGHGLGRAFLDQDFDDVQHVIATNITGTVYLIQQIARDMVVRHSGRILITGSVAGLMPGTYQAVYNGTKAFIDSFSYALRAELKDTGVTVTCLMPGATETDFFERADLLDTKVGQSAKQDPTDVATAGFKAMLNGEADVVSGWQNKLRAAIAAITPSTVLAEMHRGMAEPGSGHKK